MLHEGREPHSCYKFYKTKFWGAWVKAEPNALSTKVHLGKAMAFQWSCVDVRVGL